MIKVKIIKELIKNLSKLFVLFMVLISCVSVVNAYEPDLFHYNNLAVQLRVYDFNELIVTHPDLYTETSHFYDDRDEFTEPFNATQKIIKSTAPYYYYDTPTCQWYLHNNPYKEYNLTHGDYKCLDGQINEAIPISNGLKHLQCYPCWNDAGHMISKNPYYEFKADEVKKGYANISIPGHANETMNLFIVADSYGNVISTQLWSSHFEYGHQVFTIGVDNVTNCPNLDLIEGKDGLYEDYGANLPDWFIPYKEALFSQSSILTH